MNKDHKSYEHGYQVIDCVLDERIEKNSNATAYINKHRIETKEESGIWMLELFLFINAESHNVQSISYESYQTEMGSCIGEIHAEIVKIIIEDEYQFCLIECSIPD